MPLIEQIDQNLTKALKEKNEATVSVLRMLKSAIKNKEIEKGEELKEDEMAELVGKEAKKRKESLQAFEEGGRDDLAEKEKRELGILEEYLPEQLGEEEVRKIVKDTIGEVGASSIQDLGKVMGPVMEKVKGKSDGNIVSKIVKEELGQ